MEILIGYTVAAIIIVLLARAIFSIGTIVNNLKTQTMLLTLIAKAQGIEENDLKKISYENRVEHPNLVKMKNWEDDDD